MGFGLEKDGEILYDWEERAKTSVMGKIIRKNGENERLA